MSKTREKFLAITLLALIIGVLHFFFGRVILSAVLAIIEIGLFWIIGAGIVLFFIGSLIATICDVDAIKKAEKWIEVQLDEDDECDCDDCDCDDEDCEYHIEIRCKGKNCECSCDSTDKECKCKKKATEEEEEATDAVNEAEEAEPADEDPSDSIEK